jgi:hypothetical protein
MPVSTQSAKLLLIDNNARKWVDILRTPLVGGNTAIMEDSQTPEDRRQKPRTQVDIVCDVRIGSSEWQLEDLFDLTPQGFRMRRSPLCRTGVKVWIRIAGLAPQSAEIRWIEGNSAGCGFSAPLSEYVFDHIVRTAEKR